MKEKILVHICCGVDAVWALRKIKEEFPESHIEGFFYDPNIHPEEEYELRWIETKRVCDSLNIPCIKGDYELEKWLEKTKGYENEPERGERCTICHDLRLEETAKIAKEKGFNKITTVLMMSPKKDFQVLKKVGESVASKYGLEFVAIDFRKQGGIEKMNRLSKEMELYHQNYCGCLYALFQQRKGLDFIPELVSFGKGRIPGSREELLFIKEIRDFAEGLGLSCTEEEFDFIGWKLISSTLKVNKNPVPHTVLPMSKSIRGLLRAKVAEIKEEEEKFVARLNKSNTQLWILKTKLIEVPLKEPRFFNNPVFIVGKEQIGEIKEGTKLEFTLKAEFDTDAKSRNLIIGNIEANKKIFFHSDTMPDGSFSCDLTTIKESVKQNKDEIIKGDIAVVITGCETLGGLGKIHHEKYIKKEKINN